MTGFLLVDKPAGPTSHDVVAQTRKRLGIKRVGHAGTLDPPASGLLVLGIGPATRLLSYVQAMPKTYVASVRLGVRTSTLDAAGEVVGESPVTCDEEDVRAALDRFRGEILQVPPAVSAVKVAGVRAYKRAARGEDVALEPRPVTVYRLEVSDVAIPTLSLRMTCSSGTYVRSLVADLGDALGCGAHVTFLRRTRIGHLDVADASDDLRDVRDVLDLPVVDLGAADAALARNGRRLPADRPDGDVLVCGPDGAIGVFEATGGTLIAKTVLGS